MTENEHCGPNAGEVRYWNGRAGDRWARAHLDTDRLVRPLDDRALDVLAPAPGQRILNVGCGSGDCSLRLARRVGPEGRVTGVDVSEVLLRTARERLRGSGLSNVIFERVDAQVHPFEPEGRDAVYSRFGITFFEEPGAAFANLLRALRPGGRIAFLCWRGRDHNEWVTAPLEAVAPFLEVPGPPPPLKPGPFAFADGEQVCRLLERAGFGETALEEVDGMLLVGGGGVDEAVTLLLRIGPAAVLISRADPALKGRLREALREALEPRLGPEGVRLGGAAWLFSARRPL